MPGLITPLTNHHCFAYRLGTEGISFRSNDNGEPSGSAGKPILGQIDRLELTNTLVVVVRYFGGTLLGIPGLINAYKTTASLALAATEIVRKNIEYRVTLEFNYPQLNEILQVLKQSEVTIHRQEMALFCSFSVGIPLFEKEICMQKLNEIAGLEIKPSENLHRST